MTHWPDDCEFVTPSQGDVKLAKAAGQKLSEHLGRQGRLQLELMSEDRSEALMLPPSAVRILLRALAEMGEGNTVTLTPVRTELTTQQAADLLNVSRPYLVKLLDEGTLPGRKVGSHRRVRLDDLLAYKRQVEAHRHVALDQLAGLSQDLELGY